jgi:ribosome maturation factor RimP
VKADELLGMLTPVLAAAGLELFDLQVGSGTVTVTVDRPGGIDLDALAEANRLVSRTLDERDPIAGRYTLEVSSPGLERHLRTPEHFRRAVGETVSVRVLPEFTEQRRVRGRLASSDETGIVLSGPEVPGGELVLPYEAIERARTVFEWGPERPSRTGKGTGGAKRAPRGAPA